MAHIRPTIDGFEVALDAGETTAVREGGGHLIVEVIQGTPAISRVFDTDAEAEAFLSGFNVGVRASDEALNAAYERYKAGGEEWVHIDELGKLGLVAQLSERT